MIERFKNWVNSLQVDYVRMSPPIAVASLLLVVASWVVFIYPGPNWGIDFTGGTEIQLKFLDETEIGDVRAALTELGLSDDSVQQVNDPKDHEFSIRVADASFGSEQLKAQVEERLLAVFGASWIDHTSFDAEVGARLSITYTGDKVTPAQAQEALGDLKGVTVLDGREDRELVVRMPGLSELVAVEIRQVMGDHPFEVLAVEAVGPKVGAELRQQSFIAIMATLAMILVYVAFRFELAFAPGAVLALFHDASVTMGVFILMGKEFNLATIGALLTIVGYSLNDTIVIYDRIRENRERSRKTPLAEIVNVSLNETMSRTIGTAFTTFLAIVAFLWMGGQVIQDFAFAMLCGIVFGSYSTIFVASPSILVVQKMVPWFNRIMAGNATKPPEDGEGGTPLTQAEQRRRERASRDGAPSV